MLAKLWHMLMIIKLILALIQLKQDSIIILDIV
jgi:hypothetical protein